MNKYKNVFLRNNFFYFFKILFIKDRFYMLIMINLNFKQKKSNVIIIAIS